MSGFTTVKRVQRPQTKQASPPPAETKTQTHNNHFNINTKFKRTNDIEKQIATMCNDYINYYIKNNKAKKQMADFVKETTNGIFYERQPDNHGGHEVPNHEELICTMVSDMLVDKKTRKYTDQTQYLESVFIDTVTGIKKSGAIRNDHANSKFTKEVTEFILGAVYIMYKRTIKGALLHRASYIFKKPLKDRHDIYMKLLSKLQEHDERFKHDSDSLNNVFEKDGEYYYKDTNSRLSNNESASYESIMRACEDEVIIKKVIHELDIEKTMTEYDLNIFHRPTLREYVGRQAMMKSDAHDNLINTYIKILSHDNLLTLSYELNNSLFRRMELKKYFPNNTSSTNVQIIYNSLYSDVYSILLEALCRNHMTSCIIKLITNRIRLDWKTLMLLPHVIWTDKKNNLKLVVNKENVKKLISIIIKQTACTPYDKNDVSSEHYDESCEDGEDAFISLGFAARSNVKHLSPPIKVATKEEYDIYIDALSNPFDSQVPLNANCVIFVRKLFGNSKKLYEKVDGKTSLMWIRQRNLLLGSFCWLMRHSFDDLVNNIFNDIKSFIITAGNDCAIHNANIKARMKSIYDIILAGTENIDVNNRLDKNIVYEFNKKLIGKLNQCISEQPEYNYGSLIGELNVPNDAISEKVIELNDYKVKFIMTELMNTNKVDYSRVLSCISHSGIFRAAMFETMVNNKDMSSYHMDMLCNVVAEIKNFSKIPPFIELGIHCQDKKLPKLPKDFNITKPEPVTVDGVIEDVDDWDQIVV